MRQGQNIIHGSIRRQLLAQHREGAITDRVREAELHRAPQRRVARFGGAFFLQRSDLRFAESLDALDAVLDEACTEHGIGRSDAVVGGFSQGGGLALALSLSVSISLSLSLSLSLLASRFSRSLPLSLSLSLFQQDLHHSLRALHLYFTLRYGTFTYLSELYSFLAPPLS